MNLFKTKNNIFKNSLLIIIGNGIDGFLLLVVGIIFARILGKEMYGEYNLLRNTLADIAIFTTFGIGSTCTKFISQNNTNKENTAIALSSYLITGGLSGFIGLVVFIFAKELAIYLNIPSNSVEIRLVALLVIMNAINCSQEGILSGLKSFKILSIVSIIKSILFFVIGIFLANSLNVLGCVIALCVYYAIPLLINGGAILHKIKLTKIPFTYIKDKTSQLIKFSLPIASQECIYSLFQWLIIVLLAKKANYFVIADYTTVMQWVAIVLFIPNILRNLVLSYLSDGSQKDDKERLVSNLIKANLIIVSALVVLFGIASPIIASLYGQEFLNLKYVLAIALLVTLPDCISYVLMQEYISSSKTWTLFYFRLIRDGGFFASIIILSLIIFLNVWYLVIANLVFHIVFCLCLYLGYKKKKISTDEEIN